MVSFGIKGLKSQAQCNTNLIPNPSFEEYNQCPNAIRQFGRVKNWTVYQNSPEYFNACDTTNQAGVPVNAFGHQLASSGDGYAGIISFSLSGQSSGFREYIGAQLITPLVQGTKYYVSLKVSPTISVFSSFKYVNNKMGVLFSMTSSTNLPIPNFAHVYTDSIISDTTTWFTISGSFVADTNYQYVVVGNFFGDGLTSSYLINPSGSYDHSYYYIDDVCVSTDSLECISNVPVCDDNSHF